MTQRNVVAFGFARVRYAGQSHEIEVPFTRDYRRRFDAAHRRLYGHASADRPVEVLALRLTVSEREPVARSRRATIRRRPASGGARHPLVWRGRRMDGARYERDALPPGTTLRGPALFVEYSSTVLVPPGWRAVVDAQKSLRITR